MKDLTPKFVEVFNTLNSKYQKRFFDAWQEEVFVYYENGHYSLFETVSEWFNEANGDQKKGHSNVKDYIINEMKIITHNDFYYEESLAISI